MHRFSPFTLAAIAVFIYASSVAEAASQWMTIYNGRPGARIVMHLYPGDKGYVRTSTLGQPYPVAVAKRNLFIVNKPDGSQAKILPFSSDHRVASDQISDQEWGLSCNGVTAKSGITFRIRSPYQRFEEFGDHFAAKATTAPMFILDVAVSNPSNKPLTGEVLLGMDHAAGLCERKGVVEVLLQDLMHNGDNAGGQLCIAGAATKDIRTLVSHDILADFAGLAPVKSDDMQGGIVWRYKVPAKGKITRHFVFAGYTDKVLFNDKVQGDLKLQYTKWWKNVDDVAEWGIANLPQLVALDEKLEKTSGIRNLDKDKRFVISQSVAEHISDTHLVTGSQGKLIWMYSEAGFSAGYLSTVDLIPDTFLLNKQYFPWTLKLLVDLHSRYIFQDGYGAYVTHDVGANNFEPRGNYGESGAGHRMPVEETCNYMHLLWLTWRETNDRSMLKQHANELAQLVSSLCARDSNEDGIPDSQSNLAESNTFDNGGLIGATKNSSYLGIKVWTSCRFAAIMLSEAGDVSTSVRAADLADKAEKTLLKNANENGYFWTVLDPAHANYSAACLWVPKGMFTAYITGFNLGPYRQMEQACMQHVRKVAPLLRRQYGYAFDAVPTNGVTWQSQNLLIDLMARNYWNGMDLGVADMMAHSGQVSGLLNEFVGPFSGLASDTEWPAEQVYSRMASAIGVIPGVMPKPVYQKPVCIRWCAGNHSVRTHDGNLWTPKSAAISSPKGRIASANVVDGGCKELFATLVNGGINGLQWKTIVLPKGTYYVKLLGNETGLLAKGVKCMANGVRLVSSQKVPADPQMNMPATVFGVVKLAKPSIISVKATGIRAGSGICALEISSESTATLAQVTRTTGTKIDVTSAKKNIPARGAAMYLVDVGRKGGAVMDSRNRLWIGDCDYSAETGFGAVSGRETSSTNAPISGSPDPKLYQTYCWSYKPLVYRFDTYEPGDYLIRLLFCESFFGTDAKAGTGVGSRVMNVKINDKIIFSDFDIFKSAGGANKAIDTSFVIHLDRPDPIIVELSAKADCPSLAGIEVRHYDSNDTGAVRIL